MLHIRSKRAQLLAIELELVRDLKGLNYEEPSLEKILLREDIKRIKNPVAVILAMISTPYMYTSKHEANLYSYLPDKPSPISLSTLPSRTTLAIHTLLMFSRKDSSSES